MGINVSRASSQKSSLYQHSNSLRDVANNLTQVKADLSGIWQALEYANTGMAVDNLAGKIRSLQSRLSELGDDIYQVAEEIRREEEERARREAEARAAAARQAGSSTSGGFGLWFW